MLIFISIFTSALFGILAIIFSYREQKGKEKLKEQNRQLTRQLYELEVITSINARIGYSLNIENIAEHITLTVERLFDLATVSYALFTNESIILKTFTKEAVSDQYCAEVRKIITGAIVGIDESKARLGIQESITRNIQRGTNESANNAIPSSYFNIPLVVNGTFRGLVTITSTSEKSFNEEDMTILYKIVNQAVGALGKLEEVIYTEKGKTESLIMSLSSGAMLFLFDENNLKLDTINKAARDFLSLPENTDAIQVIESLGNTFSLTQGIQNVVSTKKEFVLQDAVLNGRHFKIFLRPVLLSNTNSVIGASLTLQDITLEKELERIRETFTNMVVHELRTPLASIKGASELLTKDTLGEEDRKRMLSNIHKSAERMLRDISDLLDASKIEAGKFTVIPSNNDLNTLIREEIDVARHIAPEKHINFVIDLEQKLLSFRFDKERIGQVIRNLLSNSVKFAPDGGEIIVGNNVKDGFVEVFVQDNGIGVPKDRVASLFSKYGQIESGTKAGGTGLGLYVSKGIVESHGGKIRMDSDEGRGARVTFLLPYIGVEEKAAVQATSHPQNILN